MTPKFLVVLMTTLFLTACVTNKYVNTTAKTYDRLSCDISQEDDCGIIYGKDGEDGFLRYQVVAKGNNVYSVEGKVDLDMDIVGGMKPKIIFYVLFMDDDQVIAERKVTTGTKQSNFNFELKIDSPKTPTKTAVEGTTFRYWS